MAAQEVLTIDFEAASEQFITELSDLDQIDGVHVNLRDTGFFSKFGNLLVDPSQYYYDIHTTSIIDQHVSPAAFILSKQFIAFCNQKSIPPSERQELWEIMSQDIKVTGKFTKKQTIYIINTPEASLAEEQ